MKLEEAIKHLEESLADPDHDWGCEECKGEHEQLLEWLRELKELREENKVLISECDRLIKEKGELLSKVSGGDVLRICQLEEQLEKAKRLLKAAIEALNDGSCIKDCRQCENYKSCDYDNRFKWQHTNEAMKLIGG